MGNSEVGHLNIGAGRVVYQDITRINRAIRNGEFFTQPGISGGAAGDRQADTALHLFGLLSDGGVHSHLTHLFALLEMASGPSCPGSSFTLSWTAASIRRQAGPTSRRSRRNAATSAPGALPRCRGAIMPWTGTKDGTGWQKAYSAMLGQGEKAASAVDAVASSYARGVTDEFVLPTVIMDGRAIPGAVTPGDGVFFYNFRPDRAREITRAFVDRDFTGFERTGGYPDVRLRLPDAI